MNKALNAGVMVWVALVMGTTSATARDAAASDPAEPPPVSEASRLNEVRALVQAMPTTTLVSAFPPGKNIFGPAFCRRLLMDLSEDGALLPLEPFAVLSQDYPLVRPSVVDAPKEADRASDRASAHKLGVSFARRVDRCVTDSPNDGARFDGFDKFVGAPPYRLYALPQALRTPRRSELIYWTERDEAFKSGRHGYAVADLIACVHRGGVSALTGDWIRNADPSSFRSALVTRGQSIVAWDVAPGASAKASVLGRGSDNDWYSMAICRWKVEADDSTAR